MINLDCEVRSFIISLIHAPVEIFTLFKNLPHSFITIKLMIYKVFCSG